MMPLVCRQRLSCVGAVRLWARRAIGSYRQSEFPRETCRRADACRNPAPIPKRPVDAGGNSGTLVCLAIYKRCKLLSKFNRTHRGATPLRTMTIIRLLKEERVGCRVGAARPPRLMPNPPSRNVHFTGPRRNPDKPARELTRRAFVNAGYVVGQHQPGDASSRDDWFLHPVSASSLYTCSPWQCRRTM